MSKSDEGQSKNKTPSHEGEDNPFSYLDVYPSIESIFLSSEVSLDSIKDDAIIVLDTSALLLPYGATQHTLEEIERVFSDLNTQGRIIIPAHVAREFAVNRTEKLKSIHQALRNQSAVNLTEPSTRILDGDEDYIKLKQIKKETDEKLREYKAQLKKVISRVESWGWNDPLSNIYNKIFSKSNIFELEFERDDLKREFTKRVSLRIPPGYKDAGKKENPYGDFIIWKTILEIASSKSKPIIFVSHDTKSDWWVKSDNSSLSPKFELVEEFRRVTGQALHIVKLSDLMLLLNSNVEAVRDIESVESINVIEQSDYHNVSKEITSVEGRIRYLKSLAASKEDYDAIERIFDLHLRSAISLGNDLNFHDEEMLRVILNLDPTNSIGNADMSLYDIGTEGGTARWREGMRDTFNLVVGRKRREKSGSSYEITLLEERLSELIKQVNSLRDQKG